VVAIAAAARRAAADAVLPRVLDALAAAHMAGWVHCDVRPANIVVAGQGAVLVDWGIARAVGAPLESAGVEDFCDERIWRDRGVSARPHHDALAALFTWIVIAFGGDGGVPWTAGCCVARRAWISERARADASVARVARGIAALEVMTGRSNAAEGLAVARGCFK
jgi:serine/threonine protein kinase